MPRCDVCDREVAKLAASRRGRWKLDLCHTCWQRLRKRERLQEGRPTLAEQAEAAHRDGPPYFWPLCELCGDDVDSHGLGYYTVKGTPRRFCSDQCKATHNSRVGAPIRAEKARRRVRAGTWQNPAASMAPEQVRAASQLGAAVRARQHRDALAAGTWENPAHAPGAREKLSRPRKHGDNPALHRAIEKLGQGLKIIDLLPEEADAHREHQRRLRSEDPERARQQSRQAYRRRMATPEGRARQQAAWERQRERRSQRPPNVALRRARERAGLSQEQLASLLGVSQAAVGTWERHGVVPRSEQVRLRAEQILGPGIWPDTGPGDHSIVEH